MTTWFKVLPLLFVLMLGSGCVTTGSREITAAGQTAGIETGKATQAEVSALLGVPAIVTYGDKGQETWNYYYVTEHPTVADFVPVVNGAVAGLRQNTRVLIITFDRHGVARNLQRSQATGNPEVYPY